MNFRLIQTVNYLTPQKQIFLLNIKEKKKIFTMSLNFIRINNFHRHKSKVDLSSSNINLNDLFNGKGYAINDDLDKDYINHCIKLSYESRYQKSKETERNKLFKRCRICRNFKNN